MKVCEIVESMPKNSLFAVATVFNSSINSIIDFAFFSPLPHSLQFFGRQNKKKLNRKKSIEKD